MKSNNNNFYVVIIYENQEHQLLVNYSSTVSQLKKIIMLYFKLNKAKYEIFYKNIKLENNDIRPLSLIFEKDPKPLLLILDSKNDILPETKKLTYLTLYSNIPSIKLNEIIEKFYEYKNIKNDADIKNPIKGLYIIYFSKASLCSDFKEFYDNYLRLNNLDYSNNNNNISTERIRIKSKTNEIKKFKKNELILPLIKSSYNINNKSFNKFNKENEKNKNLLENKDDKFHDRKKYLDKVILNNSKADMISEKNIRTGKYLTRKFHINSLRKKYNDYKGIYKQPYMNWDEKCIRERYLDKKNWLNKKGFLSSIKVNNRENEIPNYVTATPSEPPLLYKYRNVSKDKWINPKGFL